MDVHKGCVSKKVALSFNLIAWYTLLVVKYDCSFMQQATIFKF